MAGSYNHATNDDGSLRDPLDMGHMIENGGDAYEAIEEMYGMIWFLAKSLEASKTAKDMTAEEWVKWAEREYRLGILESPTQRPAMF